MRITLLMFLFVAILFASSYATDDTTVITGGRLYDNWWKDSKLPEPDTTHPAYPAGGKKSGATTWRCKECHGWDYRGAEGAYRNGSHFTGIKGIRALAGKDPQVIVRKLTMENHDFSLQLGRQDLEALAAFVATGQLDMGELIDADTRLARGDAARGKALYKKNCGRCHGKKGTALNVAGKDKNPQYVGDLARANPWETLHKIRFGHPGARMGREQMHNRETMTAHHEGTVKMWEAMPPMYSRLSIQEQADLLRYIQNIGK